MNATHFVSNAQRSNDSQQLNLSAAANPQSVQAQSQDFAGALNDARPAGAAQPRKSPANTQHAEEPSGGQLPPSGNPAPTGAPKASSEVVPAHRSAKDKASAAPGALVPASGAPEAAKSSAGGGTPPLATPVSVAAPAVAAASGVWVSTDPLPLSASPPVLPSLTALVSADTVSASLPGVASGVPATDSVAPAKPQAMAVGLRTATAAGHPTAAAGPTTDSTPGTAPAATDATLNGARVVPNSDTAAQDVMASALAQGSGTPQAQGEAAASGLAATPGLAEGAAARPPVDVSAAVNAVTAASIAQLTTAGGTSGGGAGAGADKHSRGGGSDSFLASTSDGTAAAQLLSSPNSSVSDLSPAPMLKVFAGVDSAEFGQGVADGVGVMLDGNLGSAKLQVNPPALGPIEVRIALQTGHVQVWFTSHSAVTRDALESSTPKLREMLGAQGFGQVSVDISQRSFQDRPPQPRGYEAPMEMNTGATVPVDTSNAIARGASGLLDAYA